MFLNKEIDEGKNLKYFNNFLQLSRASKNTSALLVRQMKKMPSQEGSTAHHLANGGNLAGLTGADTGRLARLASAGNIAKLSIR